MSLERDNLFDVTGKVVVITGGGTGQPFTPILCLSALSSFPGLGLMMASALEHNGATVYILGRRLNVLQQAAKDTSVRESHTNQAIRLRKPCSQKYGKIIPLSCDVTDKEDILAVSIPRPFLETYPS